MVITFTEHVKKFHLEIRRGYILLGRFHWKGHLVYFETIYYTILYYSFYEYSPHTDPSFFSATEHGPALGGSAAPADRCGSRRVLHLQ